MPIIVNNYNYLELSVLEEFSLGFVVEISDILFETIIKINKERVTYYFVSRIYIFLKKLQNMLIRLT